MKTGSFEQQLFDLAVQLGREQIGKVADYVEWVRSRHTNVDPATDYYLEPRIREGLGLIGTTELKLLALTVRYIHGDSVRDLVEPFSWDERLALDAVLSELRDRTNSSCRT